MSDWETVEEALWRIPTLGGSARYRQSALDALARLCAREQEAYRALADPNGPMGMMTLRAEAAEARVRELEAVVEAARQVVEKAMPGTRLRYMGTSSTPVEPRSFADLQSALAALEPRAEA